MHDNRINFAHSAQVALQEANELINEARNRSYDQHIELGQIALRRQAVDEMERSLHVGLLHIMTTSQKHDGPVDITRDGMASFFWWHETSKYHGGLIFHRNHNIDDVIVGTWSIHT